MYLVTHLLRTRQRDDIGERQSFPMDHYRTIIRLTEEPRTVELEIITPLGTRSLEPVDEALLCCGVRAIGKSAFDTVKHSVFLAKLVEGNRSPLEADRIGHVLDVIRLHLRKSTEQSGRSLAA